MITRVEVLGYRCLRSVAQDLSPFMLLVGPNASGKTSFLDAIGFLSDALRDGVSVAVSSRASDLASLFWQKQPSPFEIAVEIDVPESARRQLPQCRYSRARYEVRIGFEADRPGELAVLKEAVFLPSGNGRPDDPNTPSTQLTRFPSAPTPPDSVMLRARWTGSPPGRWPVLKEPKGAVFFSSENRPWKAHFRVPSNKLALAELPEDHERFPTSLWIREMLLGGVHRVFFNTDAMRIPSPARLPTGLLRDGSNLPWLVTTLRKRRRIFSDWLSHIRIALPDLEDVRPVVRPEDRTCYLMLRYKGGVEIPSWSVSDGSLRLMALTLIAYLDEPHKTYLVEEPEDGIYPQEIEIAYQSLSSVYSSQVLCTTHSPMIVSLAQPSQILCLARDSSGASHVLRGDRHPHLIDWRRSTDLGTLFASGALG